ncbi:MAG TPA: response regulator [Candidatus Saccharimonadales bacterium]
MAKKVLIIEDDRFISEMYARSLKKEGYEVDEVITGPEGYDKAKDGAYDFVLLDIMIPDKTGVEVLEDLRGQDGSGLPDSKIVIMTNFEQDDATRQSMEKLADGYLIKAEITPKRLVDIINAFEEPVAA